MGKENGAITVFAEVRVGDELVMMKGNKQTMVDTMNRSVKSAFHNAPFQASEVRGALVVYCAGCRLALDSEVGTVVTKMRELFEGKPFVGLFPFGEQGQFITGENRHGNLMFSMSVFGTQKSGRVLQMLGSGADAGAGRRSSPPATLADNAEFPGLVRSSSSQNTYIDLDSSDVLLA